MSTAPWVHETGDSVHGRELNDRLAATDSLTHLVEKCLVTCCCSGSAMRYRNLSCELARRMMPIAKVYTDIDVVVSKALMSMKDESRSFGWLSVALLHDLGTLACQEAP